MGSENIALIRNIRSAESVSVGGNGGAKENTARKCIHELETQEGRVGKEQ